MDATKPLPPEDVTEDGKGKKWVDLAVRHGLAVRVLAGGEGGDPVVDGRLLRQAEEARAESGMEVWLKGKKAAVSGQASDVKTAEALLNGEGDPNYDETEPTGEVATPAGQDGMKIEQTMQHHAMIDMGLVKKVAMWACSNDADPNTAPEWVPQWAKELAYEGRWSTIDAVVNWVKGLKG